MNSGYVWLILSSTFLLIKKISVSLGAAFRNEIGFCCISHQALVRYRNSITIGSSKMYCFSVWANPEKLKAV